MAQTTKVKIKTDSDADDRKEADPKDQSTGNGTPRDDKDTADAASGDTVRDLEEKIESSEKEAKETYDRFLRVSAEFENYKKRSAREMIDFRKFANESIAKAMLPVVDNLELAVNSAAGDGDAAERIIEGIEMTLKEVLKVFEQFGITQIDALEKAFDPVFHQAVMHEETEDHPDNSVVKELQRGYMIHDRLLRPSMVVVSKAKE